MGRDIVIDRVELLEFYENLTGMKGLSDRNYYYTIEQGEPKTVFHKETLDSYRELEDRVNKFLVFSDYNMALKISKVNRDERIVNFIRLENHKTNFVLDKDNMNQTKFYVVWDAESDEYVVRNTRCKIDPFTEYMNEDTAEKVIVLLNRRT